MGGDVLSRRESDLNFQLFADPILHSRIQPAVSLPIIYNHLPAFVAIYRTLGGAR